ncbi:MAG: polyprenyl synthetase family protein [Bacteroidales bacterium]|nr:polyprenyl synthetase family protein [Bacteroidales bacterium]
MNRESIISLLGGTWTAYSELIRDSLRSDIPLLEKVNSDLLSNGGKQIRPMLSLLVSSALGQPGEESAVFAAATQLIHNATLFHDDVADCSSLRRGKPTLSAVIGPSAAVLVGDFWLSRAVRIVVSRPHQSEAIELFSKTLSDLAEGEMLQLQMASDASTAEKDYLRIIYCKTASLFETACRLAACSVDATQELTDAAGRYGAAVGMAFQIRDDIFDYQQGEIGKPVGLDLTEQKITLPLLGAMKNLPQSGQERIREQVRQIPDHPENCEAIRSFVLENGGVEYAGGRLGEFIAEAESALAAFPESGFRDALAALARYNAVRTK